jgi:hypothetical protein
MDEFAIASTDVDVDTPEAIYNVSTPSKRSLNGVASALAAFEKWDLKSLQIDAAMHSTSFKPGSTVA